MSNEELDPEDRRQHLEFIQAAVTRMSAASSTTKGWLLPVVTAAYGYALTSQTESIAALGLAAVLLFALLDANYLNQERAFRRLYDAVVQDDAIPRFAMDPVVAQPEDRSGGSGSTPRRIVGWFPPRTVWSSWAIAPFYGSLGVLGLAIVIVGRCIW